MLHMVSQLDQETLDHCVSTCNAGDEVVFIAEAAQRLLHPTPVQIRQEPCSEQLNLLTAKNVMLYGINADSDINDKDITKTITKEKKQQKNTTGTVARSIRPIDYDTFVLLVTQATTVTSWY